jgi:uncharacterized protein YbjT (DUF2867 family)
VKVTVFGAGGATGRLIVDEAVAAGHEVTAFVRTPGKLALTAPNLTIVQGDATDPDAVEAATADAEAVISAVGGPGLGPSTQITDCVRTIVSAIDGRTPAVRFLSISTVGAGDSGQLLPLAAKPIQVLLHYPIKDHSGAEAAVMASDLRWTIARCTGLSDRPPRGHVHASLDEVKGTQLPRADVASWIVSQLGSDEYLREAVALW